MARYFSPETDPYLFKCPCGRPECDAPAPSLELLELLDAIREALGRGTMVDSGPRCAFWNREVGGEDPSTHLHGEGADVMILSTHDRELVDDVRRARGYRRLGVGNTFMHVDVTRRPEFAQGVMWHYYGLARKSSSWLRPIAQKGA